MAARTIDAHIMKQYLPGAEAADVLENDINHKKVFALMDSYLKPAFEELFREDGLTVLGRGLGISQLFSKFALYYSNQNAGRKLVLCLNCTGTEEQLQDLFLSSSDSATSNLPQIINNEVNIQDRVQKYTQGGCYIITSRILIVDILDNKVDSTSISGLLVYNAHRISETSVESFIIKVFRERNRLGFVKGFSEDPEALYSGFGKVERLMRVLYVKKLYLWPRFRMEIVETLKKNREPEVVELVGSLTPSMKGIQSAILSAMNSCIQELKKAAPHLETSQMTLENGLFQAFDVAIKNQLEAEWHRTLQRTKQLVTDVGVLRKLLDYLIRYDAFAFYYLLMKLQVASSEQISPSLWLTSEAANQIFRKAKERVFRISPITSTTSSVSRKKGTNGVASKAEEAARALGLNSTIVSCGECPPKWRLAVEVIAEIRADYTEKVKQRSRNTGADSCGSASSSSAGTGKSTAASTGASTGASTRASTGASASALLVSREEGSAFYRSTFGRVLVVVKDSMSLAQLRDVLVVGTDKVRDQRYRWFVSQQAAEIRSSVRKQFQQKTNRRGFKRPGGPAGTFGSSNSSSSGAIVQYQQGHGREQAGKTARAEDGSRRAFMYPNERDLMSCPSGPVEDPAEDDDSSISGDYGIPNAWFDSLTQENKLILIEERSLRLNDLMKSKSDSAVAASTGDVENSRKVSPTYVTSSSSSSSFSQNVESVDDPDQDQCSATVLDPDLHLMFITHSEAKERFTVLHDCCPAYVVLYDPDITIIRTIETYQASLPFSVPPVKVYFLLYEGSGEEHRYAGALSKEKKAFDSLISAKEHMVISLPDHPADVLQESEADKLQLSMDTRTHNKNAGKGRRSVVVDVRDFRCTLPSMLYTSGMFRVIPRTLTVGDYVLSPEICVERKGISDLFQSFASGRLYNQTEAMFRYYKHPCLLIEFNQDKAFCLLTASEIPPDILQHAITTRLSLLVLSFPNLRILWARSAACTVRIFRSLVGNHAEVDPEKAVAAGSLSGDAAAAHAYSTMSVRKGGAGAGEEEDGDGEEEGEAQGAGYYDEPRQPATAAAAAAAAAVVREAASSGITEEGARASAREILLSLPGVNVYNFRNIMAAVTNLAELSCMSVEQLQPLIGIANAKKLYTFFGQTG